MACGRRWGKTTLAIDLAVHAMIAGKPVAWGAPQYKLLAEPLRILSRIVHPTNAKINLSERRIELSTGGSIQFWSLLDHNAGRGTKYALWIIDEAAFVRDLASIWNGSILPTLVDLSGHALFASTPNGHNDFYQLWQKGLNHPSGWHSWQMPTSTNPHIPAKEIERIQTTTPESTFRQEFIAQFEQNEGAFFRDIRSCINPTLQIIEQPEEGEHYTAGLDLARKHDFTVLTILDSKGQQVVWKRWRNLPWKAQLQAISEIAKIFDCQIRVDATGVGDPFVEQLQSEGLRVEPIHFSATRRQQLLDNFALRLENKEIALLDIPIQTAELEAFHYSAKPGRPDAPSSGHDDCIMALALAAWRPGSAAKIY
ncbi:MAG: terminase family protein [Fimbriimonadaceae bacterium]